QRIDRPVRDCKQVENYDPKTDRFTVGDALKVTGKSEKGARMIFDNRVGTIQGDGPLSICPGLECMRIKAAGRLKSDYNTVTDSTEFELTGEIMTGVELPLPKVLLEYLIKDIKAATF
ncbi:MAG: hypothetical protein ACKOCH_19685, partial [Bacteroidota bacterium]